MNLDRLTTLFDETAQIKSKLVRISQSQSAEKTSKKSSISSVAQKVVAALFSPYFTAGKVLVLCFVFTGLHTAFLIDYGFNKESLHNLFTWQFVHRSYAHNLSNGLILFGFVGSTIAFSFVDLFVISAYVYFVSFYDPFLFYGASGLVFLFFGRALNKKYILKKYRLWHMPIEFPYLSLVLYCILLFLLLDFEFLRVADCLHLFCFAYGLFYDSEKLSFELKLPRFLRRRRLA